MRSERRKGHAAAQRGRLSRRSGPTGASPDVFLCYNSKDKTAVAEINTDLRRRGLRTWLDLQKLQPGLPWMPEVEAQIKRSNAAAVFVGANGFGSVQEDEYRALLVAGFGRRRRPVIPVILPDYRGEPDLPPFLKNRSWVDFREEHPDPLEQLVCGIAGEKPRTETPVLGLPERLFRSAPLPADDLARLPYRCNRRPQIRELESTLPLLKKKRPARPLVLLMVGHTREAPDRFFDRLAYELLPEQLDIPEDQPLMSKGPCPLDTPRQGRIEQRCDELWRQAAKRLFGPTVANLEDMVLAVAGERCPVIFNMVFSITRDAPLPGRKLMRAWLARLGSWPEPDRHLVFVLRFSWGDSGERSRLFRKNTSRKVDALVKDIERSVDTDRLSVVRLPLLESVEKDDVVDWVGFDAGRFLRREGGGLVAARYDLEDRLYDRVDELFDRQDRLPMEELGRRLRSHLKELLATGGSPS